MQFWGDVGIKRWSLFLWHQKWYFLPLENGHFWRKCPFSNFIRVISSIQSIWPLRHNDAWLLNTFLQILEKLWFTRIVPGAIKIRRRLCVSAPHLSCLHPPTDFSSPGVRWPLTSRLLVHIASIKFLQGAQSHIYMYMAHCPPILNQNVTYSEWCLYLWPANDFS